MTKVEDELRPLPNPVYVENKFIVEFLFQTKNIFNLLVKN